MDKKCLILLIGALMVLVMGALSAQPIYRKSYDWPMFGQDLANSRYNPKFSDVPIGKIELLAEFSAKGSITSSPALADLTGDGQAEIIFGSGDTYVYALKNDGQLLWKYKTGAPIISSAAVSDLDGQGLRVIIGSDDGNLYSLDSQGQLVWKYQTAGRITASPIAVDFNGDSRKEIVFGSWDKTLYLLDSNGKKITSFKTQGKIESTAAVGDIDLDGQLDIVFGSDDNKIYIISPSGKNNVLKRIGVYATSGDVFSSPSLADLDGDGFPEIVVGSTDGAVYCLRFQETGREEEREFKDGEWVTSWEIVHTKIAEKWSYQTAGEVLSSPGIADLNGDGILEIVIGSKDNNLYFLTPEGKKKIKYTINDRIVSSPGIADLDGEGKLEVIIVSLDGKLYILNSGGFRIWEYQLSGRVLSSPVIADLDGDGTLEIVIGDMDNKIYIFGQKREDNHQQKAVPLVRTTTSLSTTTLASQEPPVEEDDNSTSYGLGVIGSFLLNSGLISSIPLFFVTLLAIALLFFSYQKGTSMGKSEALKEEEDIIHLVLEERSNHPKSLS